MYSARQVYVASFLGSPIAGAWIMSLTFRALNRNDAANTTLMLGVVATVVAAAVAYLLPEKTPNLLWPLAYSITIYYLAKHQMEADVNSRIENGGRRGSWWIVFGVSALCAFVVILLALGVYFKLHSGGSGT
jgi:threonine/homoserine/homoserine lactone efflux protein